MNSAKNTEEVLKVVKMVVKIAGSIVDVVNDYYLDKNKGEK